MNRYDGSDGSGSEIGRKRNSSDSSDSDSVELPTPLPIFDLHWIVTLLALPIPTPLPIPSLVCALCVTPRSVVDQMSTVARLSSAPSLNSA